MNMFDFYSKKRISYVLTTKNRAKFLDHTLKGCRDLVTFEDELIVIDGASTDNTKEIVEKYRDIVNIFVSEPDFNGMHAQNKAILLSSGKYFKTLNDDDTVHKEGMIKAIEFLEKNPEIDLLVCGGVKVRNGKSKRFFVDPNVNYGAKPEDIVLYGAPGIGQIVRRSVFAKVGLVAQTINADMEFAMRCIAHGCTVRFEPIDLFYHEIFDYSTIIKYRKKHMEETFRHIKQYCGEDFLKKYKKLKNE